MLYPIRNINMERINGRDPKEKLIEDLLVASKKKWYEKPFGLILIAVISVLIGSLLTKLFG